MACVVGVDLGTSGLKALALSPDGNLIAASSAAYQPRRPKEGWCEQDAEEWRRALRSALSQLAAHPKVEWPPAAVGFSGQMHGSVFLDSREKPLSPVILWNDQRTADECGEIERLTGGRITEWTLNPPRAAFTAAKMLWTRQEPPVGLGAGANASAAQGLSALSALGGCGHGCYRCFGHPASGCGESPLVRGSP